MKRFFNGLIALIVAAGLVLGTFWLLDITKDKEQETTDEPVDVTSSLTGRIYALEPSADELAKNTEKFMADVESYVADVLAAKGGGSYTNAEGKTVYVSPSGTHNPTGGSSGSSGSSSSQSGWTQVDVGWDFGGGGEHVDLGNYCSSCGTYYYGNGLCPNGCQDNSQSIDW